MTAPFDDANEWDDDLDELEIDDDEAEENSVDAMTVLGGAAQDGERGIVYIRRVQAKDLPKRVTDQIEAAQSSKIDPEEVFYAICDEGQPIGLFDSRDVAFIEARSHDLTPVSVH